MRRVELSWPTVAFGGACLVLLGVGGAYLWLPRPGDVTLVKASNSPAVSPAATASGRLPDVAMSLSDDAIEKAGVVVGPVTISESSGSIRLAGVVEPEAYRQVVVAPLVAGRVTRVAVTLGEQVARNAPLVEIYSPDLAEAQTRYLSMRAEFQAVEQEIARTGRLVEIGAASQQELERIRRTRATPHRGRKHEDTPSTPWHDTTAARFADLNRASRCNNNGRGTDRRRRDNSHCESWDNSRCCHAPSALVDLSTFWIVGELYERDFARVSVGTPATITTTAYPDLKRQGRIAYIDRR
jgi:cobalt-zinc-cadmium efflux system membrane fusion protein